MKALLTYFFITLVSLVWLNAQDRDVVVVDSTNVQISESIKTDTIKVDKIDSVGFFKNKAIFLGVDVFHPILSAFVEKQGAQAFLQIRWNRKWEFVAEAGFETNVYVRNGFDVDASGPFGRIGANYYLTKNPPSTYEGFYLGIRLGYSAYEQEINQFPIRGFFNPFDETTTEGDLAFGSLAAANVSAFWAEPVAGAKVKLWKTNFYADVSIRPQVYLGGKQQENFDNLVVPGFGKEEGTFNFNFIWGISYKF